MIKIMLSRFVVKKLIRDFISYVDNRNKMLSIVKSTFKFLDLPLVLGYLLNAIQ